MTQFARPNADQSNPGLWVDQAGGSVNLFTVINDAVLDSPLSNAASIPIDLDYIESPTDPTSAVYVAELGDAGDPQSSTGHVLHYRYGKSNVLGRQIDMTIELRQADTVIAQWVHVNVDVAPIAAAQTLTGAQAASITNYGALRFVVLANGVGGGAARSARVTWVEFECPDASDLIVGPGGGSLILTPATPIVTVTENKAVQPGGVALLIAGQLPIVFVSIVPVAGLLVLASWRRSDWHVVYRAETLLSWVQAMTLALQCVRHDSIEI